MKLEEFLAGDNDRAPILNKEKCYYPFNGSELTFLLCQTNELEKFYTLKGSKTIQHKYHQYVEILNSGIIQPATNNIDVFIQQLSGKDSDFVLLNIKYFDNHFGHKHDDLINNFSDKWLEYDFIMPD